MSEGLQSAWAVRDCFGPPHETPTRVSRDTCGLDGLTRKGAPAMSLQIFYLWLLREHLPEGVQQKRIGSMQSSPVSRLHQLSFWLYGPCFAGQPEVPFRR